MNSETNRKLRELGLSEVITEMERQQRDPATLTQSFEERFQQLIDALYQHKYNEKIQSLIRAARFRFPSADMRNIVYEGRDLDRNVMNELADCRYISLHQSVVLQGYTGSGKTYCACALGKAACMQQIKTRYIRLPDLLIEYEDAQNLSITKAKKVLNKYAKFPLLILDEWLMGDISKNDLFFLFELIERRSDQTSTIFCTQYARSNWVTKLGKSTMAEAIVDRYAYSTTWIETGKKNMREYYSQHSQN